MANAPHTRSDLRLRSRCFSAILDRSLSTPFENWIWPVFRDGNEPPQVARRTRLRSSGNPARPYIWRLIILIRLTLPSTTPEFHGRVSLLLTSSRGLPAWRKSLFRSLPGVSPGKAKGLLVGRRLSNPAALPGVRRVIVTGQRMFVMPAWGQLRGAAAAPGRRDRGAGRAHRGPSVPAGARPRRSCC